MDIAKLKSKMILYGDTGMKLAKVIGISPQTFSAKLNEKNGAEFTKSEINKIKERYALSPEEMQDIFFTENVSYETKLRS